MKAKVTPTQDINQLEENLEKRVSETAKEDGKLVVELEDPEKLGRIPGIEEYTVNGETREGLKGRPVQEEVYAKLESREDAVKCLLATIEGYDLRILNSGNEWDLRQLKKYNPDIKHIKQDEPLEMLPIEQSISDIEGTEKVDVKMPDSEDELEMIYREMLT